MPLRRSTRTRRSGRRPARATRYRRKSGYYPRIRVRRRPMTKRRILNVTSKKKQDNMLPYVQNAQGAGQALGPIVIPSTGVTSFIFSPTARNYDPIGDTTSTRNSQTIFARGFKEKISMRMSDGTAWRWRRIIFAAKGLAQSAPFPPIYPDE